MRPSSWEDILGLPAQMEAARPLKNAEKHRAKSGLSKFSGDVYLFMGMGMGQNEVPILHTVIQVESFKKYG